MSKKPTTPAAKDAAIAKDKLLPIIKRLESGERALIEESKALGFSDNGALRAALREHLGGKAKYRAMIEKGMAARAEKATAKATVPPKRAPRRQAKAA
jgi:hypothetical protein